MNIKKVLLQWSINFLIKKSSGRAIKNENISYKELVEELHKTIISKFNKRKVHSSFIDNIWGASLAGTQLISTFHKEIRFLLCVIDISKRFKTI